MFQVKKTMWLYALLFLIGLYWLIKRYLRDPFPTIPGPTGLPLLGNLLQLDFHNAHIEIERLMKKYGDIYKMYLFRKPVVVVSGKDVMYELLVKKGKEFSGRVEYIRYEKHTGGYTDVSFADSQKPGWHELKKFIMHHMKGYGTGFKFIEGIICEAVDEMIEKLTDKVGTPFNFQQDLDIVLANIVYMMAFGKAIEDDDEREFIMRTAKLINVPTEVGGSAEWLDVMPWLRFFGHPAWRDLCEAERRKWQLYKVWKERTLQDEKDGKDMTQNSISKLLKMIEKSDVFTETTAVVISWELFFAGTLTTSGSLGTLFYLLMDKPEIQKKLHEEIDRVTGARDVLIEDRRNMPYHQATIYELLR